MGVLILEEEVDVDTLLETLVLTDVDTLVVNVDKLELNEVVVEMLVLALEYVE